LIKEKNIKVSRTARFYTLGELNNETKVIWFVIHGYGQLARNFIKSFEELANYGNFIVAPEALSRFYLNGGYGDTGASWMTKEDRENDINDYVNYLDELYSYIISSKKLNSCKVNTLGFSQGVATVSRWIILGKSKIDKVTFWAGEIAKDLDYSKIKDSPTHLVFGNKDLYFPGDSYKMQEAVLDKYGVKYKTHIFEGGHEVSVRLMKVAGVL
jgi:predicted esterase